MRRGECCGRDPALWYDVLPRVTRPGRYTNREWNAIHKEHAGVRLRVALAYPDTYELGMSHLGLRILYHLLNERDDTVAERVYAPWTDMEEALRARGLLLTTLESATPLRAFDIVGFTLPYELLYTNVLNMLDLGGIPVLAAERTTDDPVVIAGGPCACNPEPLTDFIDAFVLGDGEEVIGEIAEAVMETGRGDRQHLLQRLSEIEGVYVPGFYDVTYAPDGIVAEITARDNAPTSVRSRVVADLDRAYYPTQQIVPYLETVHDRVTLEVMRGCARGCRFCQAGVTYRPVRKRSVDTLLEQARRTLAATGHDEVSLMAFSSADYPDIEELAERLIDEHGDKRVNVSLPSLRMDTFSVRLAERVQRVRRATLTFAPEAATARLREVINKQATDEDLFAAASAAFQSGWNGLKLYFMIGLPTETDDDAAAIGDLLRRLVAFGRRELGTRRGRLRINASVTPFVPKPHTPFQWTAQASTEDLDRHRRLICGEATGKAIHLSWRSPEQSLLEATFALGDRRLGTVVGAAWEAGARFDAWDEMFDFQRWKQAFAACGLDPSFYAHRARGLDERLPWDHLSYGQSKEWLTREIERARGAGGEVA
ncbi:Fe-S oxidoreductase [candidate division KD3-62 bacterium DG_56]|uniref:Fe-S oxidoreductase n=1 Tax=candidate division KD3-62 bacterium DG_56 TaxID=1704032 RepID=A0A0S7XJE7_9BACT|nr:MAG: Fe-S oxidoreductase [candidate division KD3-62 bacterium DG_56]